MLDDHQEIELLFRLSIVCGFMLLQRVWALQRTDALFVPRNGKDPKSEHRPLQSPRLGMVGHGSGTSFK